MFACKTLVFVFLALAALSEGAAHQAGAKQYLRVHGVTKHKDGEKQEKLKMEKEVQEADEECENPAKAKKAELAKAG